MLIEEPACLDESQWFAPQLLDFDPLLRHTWLANVKSTLPRCQIGLLKMQSPWGSDVILVWINGAYDTVKNIEGSRYQRAMEECVYLCWWGFFMLKWTDYTALFLSRNPLPWKVVLSFPNVWSALTCEKINLSHQESIFLFSILECVDLFVCCCHWKNFFRFFFNF